MQHLPVPTRSFFWHSWIRIRNTGKHNNKKTGEKQSCGISIILNFAILWQISQNLSLKLKKLILLKTVQLQKCLKVAQIENLVRDLDDFCKLQEYVSNRI